MGIWWAAGFSTAAIRIIDDDARGRSDLWDFPLLAAHRPMFLMAGLPMDGGDVQVNKFIRILRSERRFRNLETPRNCPRGNWMKLELPVPRQFRSLASTACQVARWTGFGTHTQLYWALYQARSRLGSQLVLV